MSVLKKLQEIFFPVKKIPAKDLLSEEYADVTFSKKRDHVIMADTPEGPRVVNTCSKQYHLITNEELMTPLVKRMEKDHDVSVKVVKDDYSRFFTDFIIKDEKLSVMKGDPIFPRIRMNNSYDGSVKYSFSFGFYRQICTNGLTAPVKGMQSANFKLRHTAGGGPTALDRTMKAIEVFLTQSKEIIRGYDDLVKAKVSWDKAMEMIETVVEETKYSKKNVDIATARLKEELEQGYTLNRFLLYNAINYSLYNSTASKMKVHKKDRVDGQVLNLISNL